MLDPLLDRQVQVLLDDGTELNGTLVGFDDNNAVVRHTSGALVMVPRQELGAILATSSESSASSSPQGEATDSANGSDVIYLARNRYQLNGHSVSWKGVAPVLLANPSSASFARSANTAQGLFYGSTLLAAAGLVGIVANLDDQYCRYNSYDRDIDCSTRYDKTVPFALGMTVPFGTAALITRSIAGKKRQQAVERYRTSHDIEREESSGGDDFWDE